jgi:hypothetical protein
MRVLFVDDAGNRGQRREEPYFCLGGFSIDGGKLQHLNSRLISQRRKWRLAMPPEDEVKMQHVGMEHHTERRPNPLVREGHNLSARISYANEMLQHLVRIPTVKVMGVGVDRRQLRPGEDAITIAFRFLMERFEFSMNNETERVGVVICDTEEREDARMRQALYSGTVWTNLPNIAETVMFVPSHHSPGIQFADYAVGAMSRWWNYRDDKYLRILHPVIRTDPHGEWRGAGLKSFRSADYPALE